METPPQDSPKPRYTLEDLERARKEAEEGMFGAPNNLKAHSRHARFWGAQVKEIETYLIETGILKPPEPLAMPEKTQEQKISEELDRLYPNAKSRSVVEYNGQKYQIKYFPASTSNSGKTVYVWDHFWELYEEKPRHKR